MKLEKLLPLGFFIVASITAGHAAWEKVPLPEGAQQKGIAFMEFANPNLGYASIRERIWPQNFLIYRDGRWRLTRLGMFQGYASDISLLPNGYGWLGGRHGGLYSLFYTARTYGAGWDTIENPYSQPPGYEGGFSSLSVAGEEDVWCLFRDPVRFLRYKKGVWEEIPDPFPRELQKPSGVCFVNENEGWVCGSNGQGHYVNGRWEFVPGPAIYRLEFTAPDDGGGTGPGGDIYHYGGSNWHISLTCPAGYYAEAISFYDRNNGWACFYKAGGPGRIFKYESGVWREAKPPTNRGFSEASAVSPSDAWFLGSEYEPGKGYVRYSYHWYTEPNVKPTSLGRVKAIFK